MTDHYNIVVCVSQFYQKCFTTNDLYILMNGGVRTVGLDSIESWFHDPKRVKQIKAEVRAHEERVQETARTLEQKHCLEEKLDELNKAE